MFTKKESIKAQDAARPFITKCTEYRALLTEHELPLSVDLNTLKGAIRAQLFAKLLAVDAGLKMRFEMLRTEEAQQKLITDTIDLAGYSIVNELTSRIQQLENMYGGLMLQSDQIWMVPAREGMSLGYLASHHGLDLTSWLQERAINWEGAEHVLAYFRTLGQQLSQVRALQRTTVSSDATLQLVAGAWLSRHFTPESNQGEVEPNEHAIMRNIVADLRQQGKLQDFPNNLK